MSEKQIEKENYDRGIVPAETAARIEREGDTYKQIPHQNADASLDTSGGYTVDNEGLVNNYAVEPEMYYEQPGDLKAKEEAEARQRAEELADVHDNDETGKLTMERDERGKGSGII
jgi:hypothetical protein